MRQSSMSPMYLAATALMHPDNLLIIKIRCSAMLLQGLRSYMPLSTVQDRPSAQDSGYGSSSGAGQRLGGGSADVEAPTGWQPSSGGSAPPAASAAASAAEARVKRQNSRS